MAIIVCPNCGKKVTDRMEKCPHCHAILIEQTEQPIILKAARASMPLPLSAMLKKAKNGCFPILITVIFRMKNSIPSTFFLQSATAARD